MRHCFALIRRLAYGNPVGFQKVGKIEMKLESALEEFNAICALGHLDEAGVDTAGGGGGGPWDTRITGVAVWARNEYRMRIWGGYRDGSPEAMAAGSSVWLSLGEETFDLARDEPGQMDRAVPKEFVTGMAAAVSQLTAMLRACLDVVKTAGSEAELTYAFEQMMLAAASVRSTAEHEVESLLAENDLLMNCSNTLLSRVRVQESVNVHLVFDITASTTDPSTGTEADIGVAWTKNSEGANTHSFRLGAAECPAHDDGEVERLMAGLSADSKGHYLHALNHLHQVAHAADRYSDAQTRLAIARAGTTTDPLRADERHQTAHAVQSAAAEQINAFIRELFDEPRGTWGETLTGPHT